MKCFCGKDSIDFDSWFNWYPCEDHQHLSPVEYSREALKVKDKHPEKKDIGNK